MSAMHTLYSLHYKIHLPLSPFFSHCSLSPGALSSISIDDRFTGQSLGAVHIQSQLNGTLQIVLPSDQFLFDLREVLLALAQFFLEEYPAGLITVETSSDAANLQEDLLDVGFIPCGMSQFILEGYKALFNSPAAKNRHIDVAVGILQNTEGRIMMALCSPPKPLAGLWEFPGGKVEKGESPHVAVARELQEELGIEVKVEDASFLGDFLYIYPHLCARLFFYKIRNWSGVPHSHEHQELVWVLPSQVNYHTQSISRIRAGDRVASPIQATPEASPRRVSIVNYVTEGESRKSTHPKLERQRVYPVPPSTLHLLKIL